MSVSISSGSILIHLDLTAVMPEKFKIVIR